MTTERAKTLLYNAIVMLEEENWDPADLYYEMGMTDKEYEEVMEETENEA